MRRGTILLVAVALFVLAVPLAASAGGNSHAKATGEVYWEGGKDFQFDLHTQFSAHDDAPGAYGDRGMIYRENLTSGNWRVVNVSCVDIVGDQAFFGGEITASSVASEVGMGQAAWVKDVSTPGSGGDMIGLNKYANEAAACAAVAGHWDGHGRVTGGNLKVHFPK